MAAKRLRRLDLSPELKERLTRLGMVTCTDVLKMSAVELMQVTGFSGLTIDDLLHKCCLSQAVAPVTACALFKDRERKCHFLATSLPDLDKVLHGGVPVSTLTEIAGPAGCGKTQFCMTLSVLAILPTSYGGLGGSVFYIDTEGAFSAKRLLEICQSRVPHLISDGESLKELASKVHVASVQTCKALKSRLQNLEEDIISKNIKLIVLDSVASLVRKEYSHLQSGMIRRTDFLSAEAALLKYIAETFSIPVVVTNQITTHYGKTSPSVSGDREDSAVDVDGEGSYLTAALGNTWSHNVNTRLILQFLPGDKRQILVAKSPVSPFTCFDFFISDRGIEQDAHGQFHYMGTDPGKQAIQGREALSVSATPW